MVSEFRGRPTVSLTWPALRLIRERKPGGTVESVRIDGNNGERTLLFI